MAEELDAEMIACAHQMVELARSGEAGRLGANVAAGLPATHHAA